MADLGSVDYNTSIPNNVNLADDRRVLKALEKWHPGYLNWWNNMGPDGFQEPLVYLRTAVSVDPKGWAKFGYVRMPEYRWGVLLAPQVEADPQQRKGEFVMLVAGAEPASAAVGEAERVLRILVAELPLKQAASLAAQITGARRNELYQTALRWKTED